MLQSLAFSPYFSSYIYFSFIVHAALRDGVRQYRILIARAHEYHFYLAPRLDGRMDGWMTGWEKFVCNKLIIVKFNFRLKCFSLSPFYDLSVVVVDEDVHVVYAICRLCHSVVRNLYIGWAASLFFCLFSAFYLVRWNRQRKQHMSLDWCPAKRLIFCAIKISGRFIKVIQICFFSN